MQVEIRLHGLLRRTRQGVRSGEPIRLELQEGACVADLAVPLGVPRESVVLVVVNGEVSRPDRVLHEGDQVQIFPPVAGGGGEHPLPARLLPV